MSKTTIAPNNAQAGRAQDGKAMSPQRKALFDFVHQIMNHPYESTWPLLK